MSAEGLIVEKCREFVSSLKALTVLKGFNPLEESSLKDRKYDLDLQKKIVAAIIHLENLNKFLNGPQDETQKQFVSQWHAYLHHHHDDIELFKKENVDFAYNDEFAKKKFKDIFHKNIHYYLSRKDQENHFTPISSFAKQQNPSKNHSYIVNPDKKFQPPPKRQKLNDFKKNTDFFKQPNQNNNSNNLPSLPYILSL